MTLLDECIEILQPQVKVFPLDQRKNYGRFISDNFPITVSGKVDWRKVDKKLTISDYTHIQRELEKVLGKLDETVFIFWACADLPVLQSNLSRIIQHVDDVLAVDFDTWVISLQHNFIIEFCFDGKITLGFWET